ncbi:MAG: cation:proton antiporter [Sulfuricurvum sp.]|uniref:cation:proton antiporter domain-containing protein n=1 Tax=Sulfuricurvum sp. TaxID=2025608 RepID=UPI002624DD4F|nr:cation:proton antiporter [Sulfuricurvum sp.]MDD2830133.1 cation:proton antiporter [Sulfuricurvum sp.]MDD4950106.1 cation:proton antiporter [Sulfuricurvum sp.]
METLLLSIFLTVAIATVLNIILKRFGISHIIGYIATGTIISTLFGFNGSANDSLDFIGEFGIVFLMFTIGLELSLDKIKKMKDILLTNGILQVLFSVVVIFLLSHFLFHLDFNTSLIISLAFSLSSTAIVLTYLKESKDIHTPYGQKSMGILIFQDLAVIPILLLITFLSNDTLSLGEVLLKTLLSAVFVVVFMFTIGDKIVNALLQFSAKTELEELFLGSVFSILIGAALLAHSMGFTYSLGAFIAGMIIADTRYNVKVESDISTYKDLLLGAFFFGVGTKIDMLYFAENIHIITFIFIFAMLFKAVVIYAIIRRNSDKNTSAKTALSLAQIGEFSFAIFALAGAQKLISEEMASFLILVSVISMILTPFIIGNIYKLSSYFEKEFYESDVITPIERSEHIIVAGFGVLGKIVASNLHSQGANFIIISDNLKHVLHARKLNYMAYFGHLDKLPVLESLMVKEAKAIIITMISEQKRRLISEAVLRFDPKAKIILKIDSVEERKSLRDLSEIELVDASFEVADLLVQRAYKTSS